MQLSYLAFGALAKANMQPCRQIVFSRLITGGFTIRRRGQ
jgi:hypothetical protein